MNRAQRRAFARRAPVRHCVYCGIPVDRIFHLDLHVARHLAAQYKIPVRQARRISRTTDGVR